MHTRGLTKIEEATIAAGDLAVAGTYPTAAWDIAAARVFGDSTTAVKNCPRSAFLGLAEAGMLAGIPCGTYTRSTQNKRYALMALELLQANALLAHTPMVLWQRIMNGEIKHYNYQMHVVGALWRAKRFACQASSTSDS